MGFELRRVPINWEHPKKGNSYYHPMYEENYLDALDSWIENNELWNKGKHPCQDKSSRMFEFAKNYRYYAEYDGNPPDIEYYNTYYDPETSTWFQLYENVSEGTPVSPPFSTKEELVNYLVEFGDYWYQ